MANQDSTSTKQEPTQPGDDSSEEETTQLNRSRNSKDLIRHGHQLLEIVQIKMHLFSAL